MPEQQMTGIQSIFDTLQSDDEIRIRVYANDHFLHENTSKEPSSSSQESASCGERPESSPSVYDDAVTLELVSQLCFSTAMNSSLDHEWMAKRLKISESPYEYISSLPSKDIRGAFIDSFNVWFGAPEEKTAVIKEVISMFHNSSLIIDDFQDNSPLRRGKPSAHTIFGPAQAINSATSIIIKAIDSLQAIANYTSLTEVTANIMTVFQGQAMDLSWTFNNTPPSIQDYLLMINDKTGGLFRLANQLLELNCQERLADNALKSISNMVSLLGQHFQIRDDYMNLVDLHYTDQKGFCEDLDEGKYSLPLLHALQRDSSGILTNMLSMRRVQGSLTVEQKRLMLHEMKVNGSLDWTELLIGALCERTLTEIGRLERETNKDNPALKVLVERLRLDS
ncbi:unnamed protein product [Fusarium langsethiae]|nr:unnamed protein product [Fusarium langsethiae]